jgi:CHAD domain-containing protein/HD superfamily phosphodiesterase
METLSVRTGRLLSFRAVEYSCAFLMWRGHCSQGYQTRAERGQKVITLNSPIRSLYLSSPSLVVVKPAKTIGLSYWMLQVLEECDRVSADFNADAVHDLRVALRRCRSMADGLKAIDPAPEWKAMKKAGKQLFQRLGALRDIQVMMEWIEELEPAEAGAGMELGEAKGNGAEGTETSPPSKQELSHEEYSIADTEARRDQISGDIVAKALVKILAEREKGQKREARAALDEFDHKQWRQWANSLPARAVHIRPGSGVFKHLALERWTDARALHTRALRNRSQVALHTLRIAIKRFRYIVENFLPVENKAWSKNLKEVQDLLGEVHDLDVLWATALGCHVFPDAEARKRWHDRILEERNKRVARYREKMTGPDSLWQVWRAGLPQGRQVQALAMRRMKLWANALDPDFAHSERVAKLAVEIYDGLIRAGFFASSLPESTNGGGVRSSLQIAALLHDVGKGNKGHHKASLDLIKSHGAPLGWKAEDIQRAAIVARFHCGALPTRSHKALRDLLPDEQKVTIQLSAILRLANALDVAHDGHIRRVEIEKQNDNHRRTRPGCVVVEAEGYSSRSVVARTVAAERYLLETVLRRPVLIKAMKNPAHRTHRGQQ